MPVGRELQSSVDARVTWEIRHRAVYGDGAPIRNASVRLTALCCIALLGKSRESGKAIRRRQAGAGSRCERERT